MTNKRRSSDRDQAYSRGRGDRSCSYGGRGGGRGRVGGFNRNYDLGPPEVVVPLGIYDYSCQGDLICKVKIEDVPYFNAPIYLENKTQIGKVDEIFGSLRDFYVSIKPGENIRAESFNKCDKLFIDPSKLLPLRRFLPQPPGSKPRGGRRGFSRGGRGEHFGGRGGDGYSRGGRGFGVANRGGRWFGRGGFRQSYGGGGYN